MSAGATFKADLGVIGAGPAGVACAVQARREGLSVCAFDPGPAGGLVAAAHRVDNLPTTPEGVRGEVLARRLARALKRFSVEHVPRAVLAIDGPDEATPEKRWVVHVGRPSAWALGFRALCVATGTRPRALPAGLALGPPAARDVRELPARLAGARVAILGGGDAALDAALECAHRGARVDVLVRAPRPRAIAPLVEAVALQPAIRVHLGWELANAQRKEAIGSWSLVPAEGTSSLQVDHLLVQIGRVPVDDLVARFATPDGHLSANPAPGLYLAGDLLRERERFVTMAMADGLSAARAARRFLGAEGMPPGELRMQNGEGP